MRKSSKTLGYVAWWSFLALLLAATHLLVLKDGSQPIRFDLLRVPQGAPNAQPGFPTFNAGALLWSLGLVDFIDHKHVPTPPGVTVRSDIEYGRVGDRKLLLDLYAPEKLDHPVPCLIFIHGGGWETGGKTDYAYYAVRFAQRGYVVACISYRFVKEAPFPACVQDVKCAVRYLRANAAENNIDPEKLAAIGGSAGGHLSMMLGYTPDKPELEGQGGWPGVSSKVAVVVDLYGPTDLTVPAARAHPTVVQAMGGKSYEEVPDLYALMSPIRFVTPNAPPTLILQGSIDSLVPVSQSDALAEKLKSMGIPYWYDCLYGMPHTMDLLRLTNERCQYVMNAFFEMYLKGHPVEVIEGTRR